MRIRVNGLACVCESQCVSSLVVCWTHTHTHTHTHIPLSMGKKDSQLCHSKVEQQFPHSVVLVELCLKSLKRKTTKQHKHARKTQTHKQQMAECWTCLWVQGSAIKCSRHPAPPSMPCLHVAWLVCGRKGWLLHGKHTLFQKGACACALLVVDSEQLRLAQPLPQDKPNKRVSVQSKAAEIVNSEAHW